MTPTKPLIPVNPEGLEETARSLLEETPVPTDQGLQTKARINKQDYIKIPDINILIAKRETHKGLNWEETHFKLAENGLFMPTPAVFVPYFLSVKQAAQGQLTLYDGANNPLPSSEVEDIHKYLTSGHQGGAWTWLDIKFVEGTGHLNLNAETNHRANQNKRLISHSAPLETCLGGDSYAELNFNSQGLPTSESSSQEYVQDTNIYFYYPRKGAVAWFGADSGEVSLICGRDPLNSNSALGVFPCAEGTPR